MPLNVQGLTQSNPLLQASATGGIELKADFAQLLDKGNFRTAEVPDYVNALSAQAQIAQGRIPAAPPLPAARSLQQLANEHADVLQQRQASTTLQKIKYAASHAKDVALDAVTVVKEITSGVPKNMPSSETNNTAELNASVPDFYTTVNPNINHLAEDMAEHAKQFANDVLENPGVTIGMKSVSALAKVGGAAKDALTVREGLNRINRYHDKIKVISQNMLSLKNDIDAYNQALNKISNFDDADLNYAMAWLEGHPDTDDNTLRKEFPNLAEKYRAALHELHDVTQRLSEPQRQQQMAQAIADLKTIHASALLGHRQATGTRAADAYASLLNATKPVVDILKTAGVSISSTTSQAISSLVGIATLPVQIGLTAKDFHMANRHTRFAHKAQELKQTYREHHELELAAIAKQVQRKQNWRNKIASAFHSAIAALGSTAFLGATGLGMAAGVAGTATAATLTGIAAVATPIGWGCLAVGIAAGIGFAIYKGTKLHLQHQRVNGFEKALQMDMQSYQPGESKTLDNRLKRILTHDFTDDDWMQVHAQQPADGEFQYLFVGELEDTKNAVSNLNFDDLNDDQKTTLETILKEKATIGLMRHDASFAAQRLYERIQSEGVGTDNPAAKFLRHFDFKPEDLSAIKNATGDHAKDATQLISSKLHLA